MQMRFGLCLFAIAALISFLLGTNDSERSSECAMLLPLFSFLQPLSLLLDLLEIDSACSQPIPRRFFSIRYPSRFRLVENNPDIQAGILNESPIRLAVEKRYLRQPVLILLVEVMKGEIVFRGKNGEISLFPNGVAFIRNSVLRTSKRICGRKKNCALALSTTISIEPDFDPCARNRDEAPNCNKSDCIFTHRRIFDSWTCVHVPFETADDFEGKCTGAYVVARKDRWETKPNIMKTGWDG